MADDVRVTIDQAAMDRLLRQPGGLFGQWLARVGNQMTNGAKRRANVDTGLMRSRVEFRIEVSGSGLGGVLAARTSYAVHVHNGWRRGSGGYAGNPFLVEAAREVLGRT